MKRKFIILISVVLTLVVLLGSFCISVSAETNALIEAGDYIVNASVEPLPYDVLGLSSTPADRQYLLENYGFDIEPFPMTLEGYDIIINRFSIANTSGDNFDTSGNPTEYVYEVVLGISGIAGVDYIPVTPNDIAGLNFTISEHLTVSSISGSWFNANITRLSPPSTVTFESGYYDLKVPYVNLEASWIGESGQSVYYPIQCQVVNGFNNYVECNGFGIEYISNENGYTTLWYVDIAGLRYDWFSLVTFDGSGTSLRLLGADAGLYSTKIFFPSSFNLDEFGGAIQFYASFEYADAPPYEGNVFFDIVDAVVEALDVDVFGYFSPLDVIKSIAGLLLGLWLLKLLAGG